MLQICPYTLEQYSKNLPSHSALDFSDVFYSLMNKLDDADALHPRFAALQGENAAVFTTEELQSVQDCLFISLRSVQTNVTKFITNTRETLVDKFCFGQQSRFHLVVDVDEAQFATDKFTALFRSEKTMTLKRPIIGIPGYSLEEFHL
jgi:hypothetical protein